MLERAFETLESTNFSTPAEVANGDTTQRPWRLQPELNPTSWYNKLTRIQPLKRPFTTFIGVDLGGARGKTTAIAELSVVQGEDTVRVQSVRARGSQNGNEAPWHDDVLMKFLRSKPEAVIAFDAPLVVPACVRCTEPVCPGREDCEVPAVVWLRQKSADLEVARQNDHSRIASIGSGRNGADAPLLQTQRLQPYLHRCTEISLHHEQKILHREHVGQANRLVAARAVHLRRRLAPHGFELNKNLIEVSPRATIHSLFGGDRARRYKREADPWEARAAILDSIQPDLPFAAQSGLSREEVLRNDHCFDALISAYTAFLWAKEGWQLPPGPFAIDGWIWAPAKVQKS